MSNTDYSLLGVGTFILRKALVITRAYALLVLYRKKSSVLDISPFDLHVLGTPPAFVLSQDQTLQKIYFLEP